MDMERFSLDRHKRSKSFPDKRGNNEYTVQAIKASRQLKSNMVHVDGCTNNKKAHSSNAEIRHCLRQEILLLERQLHDQVYVRGALEKALGYKTSPHDVITNEAAIPKPAMVLIKEIAVLELQVGQLEQYLLSLYRNAFDQQPFPLYPVHKIKELNTQLTTPCRRRLDFSKSDTMTADNNAETRELSNSRMEAEEKLLGSSVQQSNTSLSQRCALESRTYPEEDLDKAGRACRSQPLTMIGYTKSTSINVISLAEHLGTRISDHVPDTPNELSEEIVKCISNIYCKLADSPFTNRDLSSPYLSLSPISAFSPKNQNDLWSSALGNDHSFEARLDNPFHVEGLKGFSGSYSTMFEVHFISRDSQKLGDTEHLLQKFRSLISQLEEIDLKKMSHEEKLAFWINVHNSLVMHAFLVYGIPQSNIKRAFLLLQAAYNVGGQVVSADTIQNSILGCRLSRPGQWIKLLLASKTRLKAEDDRKSYAIERSEPLLYFALSSGSHSDPAVRIYTPMKIFQELEAAKEDYIRATLSIRKDHKVLLPKIVESFAKDSSLYPAGIMEMIQKCLPDSLREGVKKRLLEKSRKNIEWIPHNFAFRYLITKEL